MASQVVPATLPEEPRDRIEDADNEEKSQTSLVPEEDIGVPISQTEEKDSHPASLELTRTVSNALSRVTTRMTNRHIVDPGPPPGTITKITSLTNPN